ncbi:MAG: hypothetical protein ACOCP8_06340 [archaeon]
MKDNEILVESNDLMDYVLKIFTQFKKENRDEVVIKSRGRRVNKMISIVKLIVDRFLNNVKVSDIRSVPENEGNKKNVIVKIFLVDES